MKLLNASHNSFEEHEVFLFEKVGGKDWVVGCLFVTLNNVITFIGNGLSLDSELFLGMQVLQHGKDRAVFHRGNTGLWKNKELREVVFTIKAEPYFVWHCFYVARETEQTGSKPDSNNCKFLLRRCPYSWKFSVCDWFAQGYCHLA